MNKIDIYLKLNQIKPYFLRTEIKVFKTYDKKTLVKKDGGYVEIDKFENIKGGGTKNPLIIYY